MLRLSAKATKDGGESEEFEISLSSLLTLNDETESLHFRVRFADAEAKKEAKRHDVSVQLVKSLIDGQGIEYKPAIEHVALTTSPVIPGLGPWVDDPNDPLVATKEALYEGNFFKKADNLQFSVNQKYLDRLIANAEAMANNGVKIPLQLTHEGDGNGRGVVLSFFKSKRASKTPATPLSRLPINRDTKSFLALALSSGATIKAANAMEMTIDQLIELFGLQVDAAADDAAKIAAVKDWVEKAKAALSAAPADPALSQDPTQTQQTQQTQQQTLADQLLNPRKVAMTVSMSNTATAVNAAPMKAQGKQLLETLALSGVITPAKAKWLDETYNNDQQLVLALSQGATKTPLQVAIEGILVDQGGAPALQNNGRTAVTPATAKLALSGAPGLNGQQGQSILLQLREQEKAGK